MQSISLSTIREIRCSVLGAVVSVSGRRVLAIRNIHGGVVVLLLRALLAGILLDNARKDRAAGLGRNDVGVGDRVGGGLEAGVEGTSKGAVVEDGRVGARGGVIGRVDVAGLLGDEAEDIGANVPAAEGVQVPVGLDGGQLRVVVVEVGVRGALGGFRHGTTEKDAEDAVADAVGVVLVEGNENQGAVHEVAVGKQRLQKAAGPLAGDGHRGVVAVRGHVRGDENPLRQALGLEVLVEQSGVLLVRETTRARVLVVDDRRVVLADIVVGLGLLVDPAVPLEARVGHIFLVSTPGDAAVLEKIDHGGDSVGNLVESVLTGG